MQRGARTGPRGYPVAAADHRGVSERQPSSSLPPDRPRSQAENWCARGPAARVTMAAVSADGHSPGRRRQRVELHEFSDDNRVRCAGRAVVGARMRMVACPRNHLGAAAFS